VRAHLDTTAILKGWKSISPGLRGTSYPGGWTMECPLPCQGCISLAWQQYQDAPGSSGGGSCHQSARGLYCV